MHSHLKVFAKLAITQLCRSSHKCMLLTNGFTTFTSQLKVQNPLSAHWLMSRSFQALFYTEISSSAHMSASFSCDSLVIWLWWILSKKAGVFFFFFLIHSLACSEVLFFFSRWCECLRSNSLQCPRLEMRLKLVSVLVQNEDNNSSRQFKIFITVFKDSLHVTFLCIVQITAE